MSKLSYWERRQVENMFRYMQSAEDTADQVAKLYSKASRWLSVKMDGIFERYMTKHDLTEKEARKLLNELHDKTSLDEMIQRLKSGNAGEEKKELIAKLESLPYKARIERLKQLQNQLDFVMQTIYEQEKAIATSHYVDLANEAYYRTIFDLQQRTQAAFSFGYIDSKQIDAMIHTKWSGKNYSSRIWGNTKTLSQTVKEELLINFVTGRSERETAEIIANKFAQSASNARRLIRTESAYMSSEATIKALKEAEVEEYQYMATLDLKTSEICRKLDLMIFKVTDRKVGVNCPPMHPWCRSTIGAVIDRKYLEGKKRAAIDPETGKRILVPSNMTYDEWYRKYVKGKTKAAFSKKDKLAEVHYDEEYDYSIHLTSYNESVNSGLSEAARKVAMLGEKDRCEHMYLVDLNNGNLEYYETNGEPNSVGESDLWKFIKEHSDINYAFIHNHNTDSAFSEPDMTTLLKTQNIPVMIAVRNDAVKYVAERKGNILKGVWFDELYENELKELNELSRSGKITSEERSIQRETIIVNCLLRDYTKGEKLIEIDGRK